MAPKQKSKKIPKVLEERLLIDDESRKVLKTIENMSPYDTGNLYIPGNDFDKEIPNEAMIARKLKISEKDVMEKLEHVRKVWGISEKKYLPTKNGRITENEALIRTLLNQHKLRFDPEISDYRVPRVHFYSSELGAGQIFANTKAFNGEKIFRQAMGYDEVMNSYHVQGGIMPEIIAMYGKQKNMRALLTGLNKTGSEVDEANIENIKKVIESVQKKKVNRKQMKHIVENFAPTLDSMEEAARSVAYEIAPLFKNISLNTPIHLYYSYNDDANLSEIEDQLITNMRKIYGKIENATKKIPIWHEELKDKKIARGECDVKLGLADYVLSQVEKLGEDIPKGKKFQESLRSFLFNEDDDYNPDLESVISKLKKDYYSKTIRSRESFDMAFDEALSQYTGLKNMTPVNIQKLGEIQKIRREKLINGQKGIIDLEDKIAENEQYENASMTEEREKHAWFTKKIAIKPSETKVNEMLKKSIYKRLYEEILIPELKEIIGKKLNIKLHTDRDITVYVPDPSFLHGRHEYPKNKLYGTIISSVPRTNFQRSNEPLLESLVELQKGHESAIATRLKLEKQRPDKIKDFDKREKAFSNVLWTSYGADGFRLMNKVVVAPTSVDGDYDSKLESVFYLKTPTRHDTSKLGEMMKKGNKGTWPGKRVEKGGPTTGNVMQIIHPDMSNEWFFFDDNLYEEVYKKYGSDVDKLETKIAKTKRKNLKTKYGKELQNLYDEIKVDMKYILLQNDLHLGAYTEKGRAGSIEIIRASTDVALQALGYNNIAMLLGSEYMHGHMAFRSYDTALEGRDLDPIEMTLKSKLLLDGLKEKGYDPEKTLRNYMTFMSENDAAKSTFKAREQMNMFERLIKPIMVEAMDNNVPVYLGSGNHWTGSHKDLDEVSALAPMFDSKYKDLNLLRYRHTGGQGYSIEEITLPSNPDKKIKALFSHKMAHGRTEISQIMKQAMGTKVDSLFVLTADRHHAGMIAEKERYGLLDCGKQADMPYVKVIGKAGSTRGIMAMGYSPNRDLLYSTRFWMDDVVQKIMGWKNKVDILQENNQIIKDGFAKEYNIIKTI